MSSPSFSASFSFSFSLSPLPPLTLALALILAFASLLPSPSFSPSPLRPRSRSRFRFGLRLRLRPCPLILVLVLVFVLAFAPPPSPSPSPLPPRSRSCLHPRPHACPRPHPLVLVVLILSLVALTLSTSPALISLIPGARRHHKGPQPATVAKKRPTQKRSMQRRELLFATMPSTGSGSMGHSQQLPTERSKDNRTAEERDGLLAWVSPFFFCFSKDTSDELTRLQHVPGREGLCQVPICAPRGAPKTC